MPFWPHQIHISHNSLLWLVQAVTLKDVKRLASEIWNLPAAPLCRQRDADERKKYLLTQEEVEQQERPLPVFLLLHVRSSLVPYRTWMDGPPAICLLAANAVKAARLFQPVSFLIFLVSSQGRISASRSFTGLQLQRAESNCFRALRVLPPAPMPGGRRAGKTRGAERQLAWRDYSWKNIRIE